MPSDTPALSNLWMCGDTLVSCFDAAAHPDPGPPLWQWDSRQAPDLTAAQRHWFESMDEVKPVTWRGWACLLCTASWQGGVVLIDRQTQRVLLAAAVPAAHSAELLPEGYLIVAAAETNRLLLFHLDDGLFPQRPRAELVFPDAHGVVLDRATGQLWACGANQLTRVALAGNALAGNAPADNAPTGNASAGETLRIVHSIQLPEGGAHDLSPDPATGDLIITTSRHVWRIHPKSGQVLPFAPLAQVPRVKSISIEPATGRIAFQKGEGGNWWSDTAYILTPDGRLEMRLLPGRALYKVRWDRLHQL
jgi:hypothetical protein